MKAAHFAQGHKPFAHIRVRNNCICRITTSICEITITSGMFHSRFIYMTLTMRSLSRLFPRRWASISRQSLT